MLSLLISFRTAEMKTEKSRFIRRGNHSVATEPQQGENYVMGDKGSEGEEENLAVSFLFTYRVN